VVQLLCDLLAVISYAFSGGYGVAFSALLFLEGSELLLLFIAEQFERGNLAL
jgi:hypothetical protein